MMNGNCNSACFQTTRDKLIKNYEASNRAFDVSTLPLKSTLPFIFDVVDPHPAAAATMAHAVLRSRQVNEYFGYGIGEAIPSGVATVNRRSDESDTNISRARRTIGATDFCIEAISAMKKDFRILYPAADVTEANADVDVQQAYLGQAAIYDPGALMAPIQCMSPFNLEDALFEAIKTAVQVEFEWDRKNVKKIGTLDEIPEGAAKSFLKSSGDPRNDNRFRVPEGYLWARDTQPGCEFICRLTTVQPVVIPITLLAGLQGVAAQAADLPVPTRLIMNVTVRLHGAAVGFPGNQC